MKILTFYKYIKRTKKIIIVNMLLEDDNMCPKCGRGDNFCWFYKNKNYDLGCLHCGWKGKVSELITINEFKNKNRTEWIDKMVNDKNDKNDILKLIYK